MDVSPWVAALLRERAGYAARGMDDRVCEVDVQLAAHGYIALADEPPPPPRAKTRGERMTKRGE